jgi:hypothetical protein
VIKRVGRNELSRGSPASRPPRVVATPGLRRFAGYGSPGQLAGDPWLSRGEKVSGLATWREAAVRGVPGPEREQLIEEIDRALEGLAAEGSGGDQA